jgi:CheY-like chemotaxis protein
VPKVRRRRVTDGKLSPPAILIVEDDQLLKFLTVNIVEEAGFVALHAASADEAVAILESRSDVALLLTDIDMPGSMDGLKLAHAVRNRWPPIKICSRIRPSSALGKRFADEQPLFRQALSCRGNDFRDSFADWRVM